MCWVVLHISDVVLFLFCCEQHPGGLVLPYWRQRVKEQERCTTFGRSWQTIHWPPQTTIDPRLCGAVDFLTL